MDVAAFRACHNLSKSKFRGHFIRQKRAVLTLSNPSELFYMRKTRRTGATFLALYGEGGNPAATHR